MSFEDAIRKITVAPAKKFGIAGRGAIAEGNFADLVCFRGGEVKFTIVNGRVVEKENEFQAAFAGKDAPPSASTQKRITIGVASWQRTDEDPAPAPLIIF